MKSTLIHSAVAGLECEKCRARRSLRVAFEEHRANSTIAVAACGACGYRVFAKDVHPGGADSAREAAEREFRLNQLLFEWSARSADFCAVRPIALRGSVVITEFVDSQPIAASGKRSHEVSDTLLERIGRWLAEFHLALASGEGGADFCEKCQTLERRAASLAPGHPIRRAIERLESESTRFSGRTFPRTRLHGDVKLDNFLVAGEKVIGVDLVGRYINLPEYDLAQFFGQLRLSGNAGFIWGGDTNVERYVAATLRGYTTRRLVDLDALEWLRTYFRINFWLKGRERGVFWLWSVRPLLKDLAVQT